MQIVIDIPNRIYKIVQNRTLNITDDEILENALKNGTPLPKGHWIDGVCSECGWDAGQEAFSEDANFCMKCGVKMLPIGAEKE